jgi:hypothetical protein
VDKVLPDAECPIEQIWRTASRTHLDTTGHSA